jgi:hypothetical protein
MFRGGPEVNGGKNSPREPGPGQATRAQGGFKKQWGQARATPYKTLLQVKQSFADEFAPRTREHDVCTPS